MVNGKINGLSPEMLAELKRQSDAGEHPRNCFCMMCNPDTETPVTDEPVSTPDNTAYTEAVPTVAPISDADSPARNLLIEHLAVALNIPERYLRAGLYEVIEGCNCSFCKTGLTKTVKRL